MAGIAPGITLRPPVVAGQTVALGEFGASGQGSLLALDLASGTMRWHASLGTVVQVGGVVASGDAAYTEHPAGRLGSPDWRASDGGRCFLASRWAARRSPPTGRRCSWLGSMRPAMAAWWRRSTRRPARPSGRWISKTASWRLSTELWVQDGLLVLPDLSGKVIVLDAETGAERWRFAPPVGRLGNITVARDHVWLMLENARLYGLDLATGHPMARLTELELNLNGQGLTQRPTFVGDRLIYPAGLMVLGLTPPEDEP